MKGESLAALVSALLVATCASSRPVPNRTARVPGQSLKPGESIPKDIQELIALLHSSNRDDRESGADYLAKEGPRAAPALNDLVKLLDDPADRICVAAVGAISSIGPDAASAIPAMVKMARKSLAAGDHIPEHNCWATPMSMVSLIGPAAIPKLIAELGADPDTEEVPANMLRALGRDLGPEVVLPEVLKLLDEGGVLAEAATEVIFRFGADAKPALPALVRALRRNKISEFTFISTLDAMNIQGMTTADAGTLAELRRLAKEAKNERLRLDADRVLRKLQPTNPRS